MADSLMYAISAGPVVDADVVARVLTVAIAGEEMSERIFPGSAVDFGQLSVPQDSSVTLTLVDVDDAGNKSVPAVVTFVAVDTLPPAQPGSFGVTLVGETTNTAVVDDAPKAEDVPAVDEVVDETESTDSEG